MPEVSVIIPVYNSKQYLACSISSVIEACHNLKQQCEITLIDDGGNDDSSLICDQYASFSNEYVRIIVLHQTNCGQATSRNRAINLSTGEWISFVDSDDYIHPKMLKILYNNVIKDNTRISMVGANFDQDNAIDNYDSYDSKKVIVDEDFFISLSKGKWQDKGYKNETIWGKLIKRDIVIKYPFTNGRFCEDAAIMCYWFKEAGYVSDCSLKLYNYRDNPNGTMNTFNEKKRNDKLWSILEMRNFYKNNNYIIMQEKTDKTYLWQLIQYEKSFNDKRYSKLRKNFFIRNVWYWNCSLKKKLSMFKEYYWI